MWVDLLEALQREGRAGTVAQQSLQPGAIRASNAHCRIQREAAMRPAEHVARLLGLEQAAAGEPPQHPSAHLLGDRGHLIRRQCRGLEEADLAVFAGIEQAIDDAAVQMNVAVQRGAEPVHEADGPEPRPRRGGWNACAKMGLDDPQKDVQDGTDGVGLALQVPA